MRYRFWFFGILLLLTAKSLNAQVRIPFRSEEPAWRIVVLGSSTAYGAGASPIDSAWVNRFRQHLQTLNPANEVINLAIGGYSTYKLLPTGFPAPAGRPLPDTAANITRALALQPNAVIVNLPSNDAVLGVGVAEQLRNFDTIVGRAQAAKVPVWLSTTQPRNFGAAQIAVQLAMRDSILARYGTKAINFFDDIAVPDGTINPQYNSGDGIHLNNAGHARLLQRVLEKDLPGALRSKINHRGAPSVAPRFTELLKLPLRH